jgi:hypothetical protein
MVIRVDFVRLEIDIMAHTRRENVTRERGWMTGDTFRKNTHIKMSESRLLPSFDRFSSSRNFHFQHKSGVGFFYFAAHMARFSLTSLRTVGHPPAAAFSEMKSNKNYG